MNTLIDYKKVVHFSLCTPLRSISATDLKLSNPQAAHSVTHAHITYLTSWLRAKLRQYLESMQVAVLMKGSTMEVCHVVGGDITPP
jgi:hypothetical protein